MKQEKVVTGLTVTEYNNRRSARTIRLIKKMYTSRKEESQYILICIGYDSPHRKI